MYKREISKILERFASIYPAVGIMGPRQSGKTTLAKTLFKNLPYISFENIDIRLQAHNDPRGFLKHYAQGAIFDEIQHVPDLLSYLQEIIDNSEEKGRYILTGSQNFILNQHISQTLAGRIGLTTLLPLSLAELEPNMRAETVIFKGGYPRLHKNNIFPIEFYPSYIQTYIEKDIRQFKNIENLNKFQIFIKLCAGRIGQIINFSSLAQDAGISHTTAKEWLSILEASYIIFFLQPFYNNFSKRLIKMPKLYFYDTGLACNLLGLENELQLETHYLKGAFFENLVILELLKSRINKALPPNLYFWRDRTNHEIDCIADWGGTIKAIEIKSGVTFQPAFLKSLNYFNNIAKEPQSYLIYNGEEIGNYNGTKLIPLSHIETITT